MGVAVAVGVAFAVEVAAAAGVKRETEVEGALVQGLVMVEVQEVQGSVQKPLGQECRCESEVVNSTHLRSSSRTSPGSCYSGSPIVVAGAFLEKHSSQSCLQASQYR